MVKPKQVGHLVINVTDVAASTKFYTEVLGFQIAVQRPTATFLTCGDIHHDLALFQAADDAAPMRKGNVGLNHFAVQVDDFDSLRDLYHTLKDNGVAVDRTTDHGMTGSVYFEDPDGNGIEFYYDKFNNPADGLAEMRRSDRENTVLVLD
ncbi:Biphenyl-2,3-diol 1,2-dioxygenase 3 [Geodia barretti]|uniref:Biphenyl-2,3-diol 1,2-dioxygenase 3 n=1 Tax=Geodia barretti TaxID=519541 RepID=A0AA35S751_GEOBA|nr:Biphenyl-2,3-diol 1,2-dioxygenase 3 [Geodia barretti]